MHTSRRPTAVLLVAAAVLQLLGQVLLRLPSARTPRAAGDPGSGTWVVAHVVLVLAALTLLAAMVLVARVAGLGPLAWLGLVVHAVVRR